MSLYPKVPCLLGPTASGKTKLAMDLSEMLNIELVSVDSTQIYQDMNIGSGKPSLEELQQYPHHLLDICSPETAYSAAEFVKDCTQLIEDIRLRGRTPLLVGGTMMYIKALSDGLHALPSSSPEVRAELEQKAKTQGLAKLYHTLSQVDPSTARRLDENDKQRILRALEVYYISDKPLSWHFKQPTQPCPYTFEFFALIPKTTERAQLHQRIAARFDRMLDEGLVNELQQLKNQYQLHADLPSMRSVGYRQVWQHLDGQCSFDQMREKAIAATRQLAKRQLTWLRGWPGVVELDFMDSGNAVAIKRALSESY